ncbi:MAG: hypothetical protein M3Z65_07110 [Chloroflexota bacterium]|nr:hypothetical protein [Chloroflexota bacterium]
MRRLPLVAAITLGFACVPPPTAIVPSSSPLTSFHATATPTTATPSPTHSPGPLNVTTAIGTVPRSFHYFSEGQGESFRILLFDEARSETPAVVLTSGRVTASSGPDVRSEAFTVSADGRVVVLMRRLSEQLTTYYVLRPDTGELRGLLSGADLGPPVISADGQRIAYARRSDDAAVNGLWVFAIALRAPSPARLVIDEPQRVGSPPRPLAWSADGKWLAISPVLGEGGTEVAVVDPAAGETRFDAATNAFVGGRARVLGPGYAVDWRGGERNLLVTSSRDLFGGLTQIYTADVTTGTTRVLYRPAAADATLGPAAMHPALDRYAVREGALGRGPGAPNTMWLRQLDGSARSVSDSAFNSDPWWSLDGTKLFSIIGGDDSTGFISNLLGTGGGTLFCKRGGDLPRCT